MTVKLPIGQVLELELYFVFLITVIPQTKL